MDLNLKDKVIIVTGGSKGIGLGIVESLIREEAIPVIITRNKASVDEVIEVFKTQGTNITYALAELTDPEQCKNAVQSVVDKHGRIDGLVNNAGVNDGVGLESGDYEGFMSSLKRNVVHYYLMAHYALPELKKSKGAIVNIGSKTADTGQGGTSGYAASNGGRNALTREWAVELLPYSIRVNALIVAECYTPLYEKWISTFPDKEEKLAAITKNIPLENRMTSAEEIGDTVAFLLSSKSSHTTGQLLYVDGGYTHLDRSI
ncbi:SDR family oxidoreductase [Algibacter amylolyticus]|uniref:SDR family oxidoreductase n=1 Tax=Algibacter amylolyticus TaxID=1608400 RepID=A0A5M7B0W0_9FLAO|nr:SDR family oxidoreductase [Algibacter amylolyticus]KAA5821888.1 SDR family oxidoreductase [Algibacter amylolyticus]MBB5269314.1 NAD(P)-dependent dehydrogenase (short-subunit alcohol dehydrogenase family) [Algibacter amylolyticus]TSJ73172.1 SDR family oxidoreductase [Algibacter amylolyticus]